MPREVVAALGKGNYQSADVVARSAVLLMADRKRHGELVHSDRGNYTEMENGEKGFHTLVKAMFGVGPREETVEAKNYKRLQGMIKGVGRKEQDGGVKNAEKD
jgi:hypothetical protein